jgi:hypothetical protein
VSCMVFCVDAVRVLGGAKQTSKGLAWCGCYARIRCGFPVKKSISVKTTYRSGGAGCGQFRMLCGCGAKQTSLANKQRLGAGCGCGAGARVRAYLKAKVRCWVKCCAVVLNR